MGSIKGVLLSGGEEKLKKHMKLSTETGFINIKLEPQSLTEMVEKIDSMSFTEVVLEEIKAWILFIGAGCVFLLNNLVWLLILVLILCIFVYKAAQAVARIGRKMIINTLHCQSYRRLLKIIKYR